MPGSRPPNGSLFEPPLRVESREELVYLLGEACELEHGLLCEYLYAQFSLKRSVEEGVTAGQLARMQAWELTLIDVMKQEMMPLALVDRDGEAAIFIGPPKAQATTQVFEWPELTAVTDLASASVAIELIVEQGEGARGDWVKSHFGKFVGILEDFLAMRGLDPAFEPARPVLPVYLRQPPDVDQVTLIGDRLTRRVADLFNAVYEVTLQVQSRYFVHHGETADQLGKLGT